MVKFTNVTFDKEWIYADAYDGDFKVHGKIKVHREKEEFYTDCKTENQFMKAAWHLVDSVNCKKIKQHGSKSVVWG